MYLGFFSKENILFFLSEGMWLQKSPSLWLVTLISQAGVILEQAAESQVQTCWFLLW